MSSDTFTTIFIMALLVACSAYFSATETSFSALSRTRLKAMSEPRAQEVLELLERYDDLLSTILIGNNIVNIGLASLGTVFFVAHFGDIGASLSTLVITIVVLIFGEISPKSIASDSPERFAMLSAPLIRFLIWVFTPLNFLFRLWKKLLSLFFKVQDDRKLTQEELLVLVDEVEQDGGINKDESDLLRSAIEFTDREAQDILTHRVDLEAVPLTATVKDISDAFIESQYSRILVYNESIDDIVGVIHLKDFYRMTDEKDCTLRDVMTAPLFVTPTLPISEVLRMLQKNKTSLAVVTDEYGGTLGIVTVEDILEELVGEIWDEHDEVVEDFKKVDDNTYRVSCATELEKMSRFFEIDCDDDDSATVSGWVMQELGHIPAVGDRFTYEDLAVTVTATDSRRVVEIEVKRLPPASEENEKTGG